MAKRRLNKQQKSRIERRQAAIAHDNTCAIDDSHFSEEQEGLVISHFRSQADVERIAPKETKQGEKTSREVVRCHLRANLPTLVTGDKVTWRQGLDEQKHTGIVEAIHPRISELSRPDSYGKMKLVSANITRAIIVIAPEPEAHSNLIDRYLIVAENLGLDVVLLINKCDLINHSHPILNLEKKYTALGYTCIQVSNKIDRGLDQLKRTINSGCSVFVGQSGVGKSSIIQTLLPDETIKVGELSEAAKKGRHTTTHARLYHFPEGGNCIDSPGIREFGLWHMNADNILQGFKEFRPFIGLCKFRNCTHINDKHCAISRAAENNDITQERYQSFVHIIQSLGDVTIQSDKALKS